jgi:hypothetical protein
MRFKVRLSTLELYMSSSMKTTCKKHSTLYTLMQVLALKLNIVAALMAKLSPLEFQWFTHYGGHPWAKCVPVLSNAKTEHIYSRFYSVQCSKKLIGHVRKYGSWYNDTNFDSIVSIFFETGNFRIMVPYGMVPYLKNDAILQLWYFIFAQSALNFWYEFKLFTEAYWSSTC